MATFSSTTTLTSNLADGESITVTGVDTTLTIDASVFIPTMKYGTIFSTQSIINILNNTNNVLVVEMNSNSNDIRIENISKLNIEGDFIELATGDGTVGQTIDFSSIGNNNVPIDHPSAVWVEETPGDYAAGKDLIPFMNLGDSTGADGYTFPLTFTGDNLGNTGYGGIAGDWERGRFFEFNRSTKVATFGSGTGAADSGNGHVIPNGCKVFFPNIHFTSQSVSNTTNRTSLSTFDTTSNGTLIFDKVNFSNWWYAESALALRVDLKYYSGVHLIILDAADLYLENIALAPETNYNNSFAGWYGNINIRDVQNKSSLKNIYAAAAYDGKTSSSARYAAQIQGQGNILFENLFAMFVDSRNNAQNAVHSAVNLVYFTENKLKNITAVNGNILFAECNDCETSNIKYATTPFVPSGTSFPAKYRYRMLYTTSGAKNKFINASLVPKSLHPYYVIFEGSTVINRNEYYEINIVNTDNNAYLGQYFIFSFADNTVINNCIGNVPMSSVNFSLDSRNVVLDNVRGAWGSVIGSYNNPTYQMSTIGIAIDKVEGASIFSAKTEGETEVSNSNGLLIVAFGPPSNTGDYEYELTGAKSYFDNSTKIFLDGNNGSVTISNKQPIKGITAFRNALIEENATIDSPSECTIEVEMVNAGESFTGTFTTLAFDNNTFNVYTSMQSLLSSLQNYDSDKGFNMKIRLTNISGNDNIYASPYGIPVTIDTTYVAKDASITLGGGVDNTKYEIIRDSDNVVLYTFIGTGTHEFYLANNFDVPVYFKRYTLVNGSYALLLNTQYTTQNLTYGDNGVIPLYVGNEVQVASTDTQAIWQYSDRTLTEGGFTNADRATLDKGLTTGKFLALK